MPYQVSGRLADKAAVVAGVRQIADLLRCTSR